MSPQLHSGDKLVENAKPSDVDDAYITEMTVRLKKLRALMAKQAPKKKKAAKAKTATKSQARPKTSAAAAASSAPKNKAKAKG